MFYFLLTGIACIVLLVAEFKLFRLAFRAENAEVRRLALIVAVLIGCLAIRGDYTLKLIHKLQAFVNQPEAERDY